MLVSGLVNRQRRMPRQLQDLGQPSHHGHAQLAESDDAVSLASQRVVRECTDGIKRLLEDNRSILGHVDRDELRDDAFVNQCSCPTVRVLDDHGLDTHVPGALEDESLAWVACGEEDDRRAIEQPPPQRLAVGAGRLDQVLGQFLEHLMGGCVLELSQLPIRARCSLRQGAGRSEELLGQEVRAWVAWRSEGSFCHSSAPGIRVCCYGSLHSCRCAPTGRLSIEGERLLRPLEVGSARGGSPLQLCLRQWGSPTARSGTLELGLHNAVRGCIDDTHPCLPALGAAAQQRRQAIPASTRGEDRSHGSGMNKQIKNTLPRAV
mmetsp:Transcript_67446/g.219710  ORF Transcript_67446/g.219710 Transcript_67446/m.219710 type:complete len:320 (+) Transcript_67446:453-1412(+)